MTPQPAFGGIVSNSYLGSARGTKTDDTIADEMASASPKFGVHLNKIRQKYSGDPAATTAFLNTFFYGDANYSPDAPSEKKGYLGRTLDRIYGAGVNLRGVLEQESEGEITSGQAVNRGAVELFKGVLSPATEASRTVISAGLEKTGLGEKLGQVGREIAQSDLGQAVGGVVTPKIQGAVQAYQNLPPSSGFRDLAAIGSAGVDALDVLGTGYVVGKGVQGVKAVGRGIQATGSAIRHPFRTAGSLWSGGKMIPEGNIQAIADDVTRELIGKPKEAVSKGMDQKLMTFVAEQNKDTRDIMAKMTVAAKEGGDVLEGTTKHKEILGGVVRNDLLTIMEEKENVGKALGAMKRMVASNPVDVSDVREGILQNLINKGAVINVDGKIVSLAGAADDNIPLLQQALDFLQPDDAGRVIRNGKQIDQWRTKMFQEMGSAKAKLQPSAAGQPTLGYAEGVVNGIRRQSLLKMAGKNDLMVKLNDEFENLSTLTSKYLKSIQYKGKLSPEAITAKDLKMGEVSLRTLGNAAGEVRPTLEEMITTAEQIRAAYGQGTTMNKTALIRYADALEDVFPITPTRSLRGEVSRGTRDALGNFTEDVVRSGAKRATFNRAADAIMDKIDSMRGITPENRFKLLMEVLESPDDTQFFNIIKKTLPTAQADDLIDDIGESAAKDIDAGDLKPLAESEIIPPSPLPTVGKAQNPKGIVGILEKQLEAWNEALAKAQSPSGKSWAKKQLKIIKKQLDAAKSSSDK